MSRCPHARTKAAVRSLTMEPSTPCDARAWLRATLRRWKLDDLVDTTELLAGELIGNAIRHTGRPLHVRLRYGQEPDGTTLTCEVADADPRFPRQNGESTADDESGRGMGLVALLAKGNGVARTAGGKTVWFALAAV